MGGSSFREIIIRVGTVIAVLLLVGLVLRLIGVLLTPVHPADFMNDLRAGYQILRGLVAPALPALFAVGILCAVCWSSSVGGDDA